MSGLINEISTWITEVVLEEQSSDSSTSESRKLEVALKALLTNLESISRGSPEVYDTDVRERLAESLIAFARGETAEESVAKTFGMFSAEGDAKLRLSLLSFLQAVTDILRPNSRSNIFEICAALAVSSGGGRTFEDFFGAE